MRALTGPNVVLAACLLARVSSALGPPPTPTPEVDLSGVLSGFREHVAESCKAQYPRVTLSVIRTSIVPTYDFDATELDRWFLGNGPRVTVETTDRALLNEVCAAFTRTAWTVLAPDHSIGDVRFRLKIESGVTRDLIIHGTETGQCVVWGGGFHVQCPGLFKSLGAILLRPKGYSVE
jgi:hypothetical protein